jgi:cell division protein FtsQ
MIFLFNQKRSNKKIIKTTRTASDKRPFRKNRFKREFRLKDPNRKIRLYYFFQILAGLMTVTFLSVLLIFVHDLFTQANYFNITNIDIKGLRYLSEEDIMRQSGIIKNNNMLNINLNLARKKLLVHPWIEKAQVSRIFPGCIMIEITEYRPEAIAKIKDEQYLLSSKGVLFKSLADSDPTALPIITGLSYSDIPVANLPASIQFKAVRKVLEMGRPSMALIPTNKIQEIKLDGELGLALIVIEPSLLIQIGYEHYPEKYQNLRRVLKYLKNEHQQTQVSEIDLSDLNQIVVTPEISKKSHQS